MDFYFHRTGKSIRVDSFITAFDRILREDFVFTGEMHDFWEMMYVMEGNVCASGDDRVYDLKENQIIFHKPMELHKFHANEPSKIFVLTFTLSGSSVDFFQNRTFKLLPRQTDLLYGILNTLRSRSIPLKNDEHNYMSAFYDDPLLVQQVACCTELFLISLLEERSHVLHSSKNAETILYRNAIAVMDKYLTDWITIPQMAQELNMSTSYIKRIFTKYAGMGIHKYFLKTKIIHACRLLKEGKSVSEVADYLNFSSHNYFSMVFKREMGKTPSQFKAAEK